MAKRSRNAFEQENSTAVTPNATPKKLRFSENTTPSRSEQNTPSKRGRRPNNETNKDGHNGTPQSAKTKPRPEFTTPTKTTRPHKTGETITLNTNADRSAKRKSNRKLIQRSIEGNGSEDEEEDALARQIWGDDDAQAEAGSESDPDDLAKLADQLPDTPSKRGRGRPKGSKNKRTPTPPPNIPPHERYFFHNRTSAAKSSSNTVSSQTLLSHASYHELMTAYEDHHSSNISELHGYHSTNFPLWAFELSQGYTICLFGYGSKRRLLKSFADYLHSHSPSSPKTIMINGHHPTVSIKNILLTIIRALGISTTGLGTTPTALLNAIETHQARKGASAIPIYLLISTIHARPLITATAPSILSSLAAHPYIHLVLTASNPTFPLLWSSPIRDALNILFHDATTFLPYDDLSSSVPELGIGVVDSVAELMGKKSTAAASRERVQWVLKSLPENARGLYRILVSEILSADADRIDAGLGGGLDFNDDVDEMGDKSEDVPGVDSKVLYQKASEEFLCSSEMAFRGLLREFVDHAMIFMRKEGGNVGGGEILGIDMPKEELEGVLEDLLE